MHVQKKERKEKKNRRADECIFTLRADIMIELDEQGHAVPQEHGNMHRQVVDLLRHFRTTYNQKFDVRPPEEASAINSEL